MTALAVLISGVLLLLLALVGTEIRKYQLAQMSCEKLITKLEAIKIDTITFAALEGSAVISKPHDLDNTQVWHILGGWAGLKQMHTNATLLIALAARAQAWDFPGSAVAARAMSRDALALRQSVVYIAFHGLFRYRKDLRLEYVKKAAASYYAMTGRVLRLYENSPSRLYSRLDEAVWPRPGQVPLSL